MGGNGGIVRVELIDDRDRTLADDVMQVNFIGGRTEPADVTIFTQASHVQLLTDGSGRQVVRIEGSMDGVPDNRVDIEILDTTGTVFLGTQTVYLPNIVPPGQYGEWGVNVHVPDALPGMNGQLRVFSRVGGALVASDGYDFMFREGPNTVTLRIDEPTELQAIPVNADVAEFRAAGVASNTSFVRLRLVSQGQILTETSAPVDANGRWNAILRVTVEPGTQAQLQATFGNARDFTAISFS